MGGMNSNRKKERRRGQEWGHNGKQRKETTLYDDG